MKLILMGTSSWVIPVFERAAAEHEVVAVFTRAPKPAGRKKELKKSAVHEWAEQHGIPAHTNIKEFPALSSQFSVDYIIVASYGVILKDEVLNTAKTINIHPSDLPKYRGPSPMTTAIYNGDSQSAICLMQVASEVDAGDVFMRRPFAISENDTINDVEKTVGEISSEMLSEFLRAPEKFPGRPQTGIPSFTRKWTGADEIIDWSRTPEQIHDQVRSIGGRTKINGIDCKIIETKLNYVGLNSPPAGESAALVGAPVGGNDSKFVSPPTASLAAMPLSSATPPQGGSLTPTLEILRIQPAGKKPMAWRDFVNGQRGAKIEFGEGTTKKE